MNHFIALHAMMTMTLKDVLRVLVLSMAGVEELHHILHSSDDCLYSFRKLRQNFQSYDNGELEVILDITNINSLRRNLQNATVFSVVDVAIGGANEDVNARKKKIKFGKRQEEFDRREMQATEKHLIPEKYWKILQTNSLV